MKRFVSMLLASVMTFATFGMVAFADDGQQAESASGNQKAQTQSVAKESKMAVQDMASNDIGKFVYMSKKSFEYDPSGGSWAEEYDGKFSTVETILSSIEYTEAGEKSDFNLYHDATFRIGNTQYNIDDEKNGKRVLRPGKYTLLVTAKSPYSGTLEFPFEVKPCKLFTSNADAYFNNNYYYYDGKAKCPKIADVYFGDTFGELKLKKGTDYTVSYKYKNNKYYGKGAVTATITFKGNYTGSLVVKDGIWIFPKGGQIKSAKPGKKSVKAKWKGSKDATGYKVQVFNYKNGKIVKTRVIKGKKKTSCTIKGLKRHKKYGVTVMAYKKVKGKKIYNMKNGIKTFRTK